METTKQILCFLQISDRLNNNKITIFNIEDIATITESEYGTNIFLKTVDYNNTIIQMAVNYEPLKVIQAIKKARVEASQSFGNVGNIAVVDLETLALI